MNFHWVSHLDIALVKPVLDDLQRKLKPDIHHDRQANDFGRSLEVPERAGFCHSRRLGGPNDEGKKVPLTLPAAYLKRQPLLGGSLQDAEVSARIPQTVRVDRRGPHILPPLLRLV